MQNYKEILLVTAGGTIDKAYGEGAGAKNFVFLEEPAAVTYFRRFGVQFRHLSEFAKDSLEMTDADREVLYTYCWCSKQEPVLITHGTDTLVETGKYLQKKLGSLLEEKTVVLTGALKPAIQSDSDAMFNIGMALATCRVAEPGVHIVMSGKIFDPQYCRKLDSGIFIPRYD